MTPVERARSYVERIPGAIAGAGGHAATFSVAVALVHGFALSEGVALDILRDWNTRCDPPWSESDLLHKVKSAAKAPSRKPRGWLIGQDKPKERSATAHLTLTAGTEADLKALADSRGIGLEGLQWASRRGTLRFCDWFGQRCWAVTDRSGRLTELRRLDRSPFKHGGKSHTLKGGQKAWPVGILEARRFPTIALVEGGPDLLAIHYQAIWEQLPDHKLLAQADEHVRCAPVGMMSSSPAIHPDALPHFKGKRVRIIPHPDGAGIKGASKWKSQLMSAGAAKVDFFDMARVKRGADFADLVNLIVSPILPR